MNGGEGKLKRMPINKCRYNLKEFSHKIFPNYIRSILIIHIGIVYFMVENLVDVLLKDKR